MALDQMSKEVPTEAPWEAPKAGEWDAQTVQSWIDANMTHDGAKATMAPSASIHRSLVGIVLPFSSGTGYLGFKI